MLILPLRFHVCVYSSYIMALLYKTMSIRQFIALLNYLKYNATKPYKKYSYCQKSNNKKKLYPKTKKKYIKITYHFFYVFLKRFGFLHL